ncbi:hypothetical protein [Candidatus Soleaferrea massiliensis]|uniref:hypothetical protein n=1 Tax=Candidatus Soleaferrea massiliensis TaxID=1470354 RepID=UPI00058D9C1B|nr:hypothetical protein [Candidatus Soleaferrea massiliensis]
MQLVFIVLNKTEYLEDLLMSLAENGISGATILDSTGMARVIGNNEDLRMFGALRMMFNPEREESKTIFTVLDEAKVPQLKKAVGSVIDLSKPDTGILFGVPVSFVEGIGGMQSGK